MQNKTKFSQNSQAIYQRKRYKKDPKYRKYIKNFVSKWQGKNREYRNKYQRERYAQMTEKQRQKHLKHTNLKRKLGLWSK